MLPGAPEGVKGRRPYTRPMHGRWRRGAFVGVLVSAMASATFMPAGLGIVASSIIDDLGISRAQLGGLITATVVVAAAGSPAVGRLTDVIGGRRSVALVFGTTAVGFFGLAVSPWYWVAYAPVVVASIGQAAGNPSTNKLIALHAEPGRRGVVTGIKQSGVQAGVFLGGLAVPAVVAGPGWRWAMVIVAVVPLLGLLTTMLALPADGRVAPGFEDRKRRPLPVSVWYLAAYGGLLGFGGAYMFLVPLYVEEALGGSDTVGGLAVGFTGLVALIGRIVWAHVSEREHRYAEVLVVLAALSLAGIATFAIAEPWGVGWIWAGVVLTGVSSSSWNSVGMLAVIHESGVELAGRASGVVMLGFLTGLGVAPALFGWTVDTTGSYAAMWILSAVTSAGSLVVALRWRAVVRPQS